MPQGIPIILMLGQGAALDHPLSLAATQAIAGKGSVVVKHLAGQHMPEAGIAGLNALLDSGSLAHIEGAYLAGTIWFSDSPVPGDAAVSPDNLALYTNWCDDLSVRYSTHDWMVATPLGDRLEMVILDTEAASGCVVESRTELALDADGGLVEVEPDQQEAETLPEDSEQEADLFQPGDGLSETQAAAAAMPALPEAAPSAEDQAAWESGNFTNLSHGVYLQELTQEEATVRALGGPPDFEVKVPTNQQGLTDYDLTEHDDIARFGLFDDTRTGYEQSRVHTYGGDDVVVGGQGRDVIHLGAGDDRAIGGDGFDRIYGDAGDDLVAGQGDRDYLVGGDGDDIILAGDGDDGIVGGRGDDIIRPHAGRDTIYFTERGENGSDTIYNFSVEEDRLEFNYKSIRFEKLDFSTDGDDLLIHLDDPVMQSDVRLINRARYIPDEDDTDEDVRWLSFGIPI